MCTRVPFVPARSARARFQQRDSPAVVADSAASLREVGAESDLLDLVPLRVGEDQGSLAQNSGASRVSGDVSSVHQRGSGGYKSLTVSELLGERERALRRIKRPVRLAGLSQRPPEPDHEVNRQCLRLAARRQMGGRRQRRVEGRCGQARVAARHCPRPRLLPVRHRLVPHLATPGMLREPVDVRRAVTSRPRARRLRRRRAFPRLRLLEGGEQRVHLRVAADEGGQTPRGGSLQA